MRWIITLVVLGAIGGGAWMVGNRAEATAMTDTPQVQATAGESMDCCPMQPKVKKDCPADQTCAPSEACPEGKTCPIE